jgi:5-methylcytosine-specific restriction enzyme A
MAEFPHGTKNWERLSRLKRSVQPLCELCERRGLIVPATHVHHIIAVKDGGDPFPSLDGLMSLCRACHNSITAGHIKGCDVAGLPIDPDHEFYKQDPYTGSKDDDLMLAERRGSKMFSWKK